MEQFEVSKNPIRHVRKYPSTPSLISRETTTDTDKGKQRADISP